MKSFRIILIMVAALWASIANAQPPQGQGPMGPPPGGPQGQMGPHGGPQGPMPNNNQLTQDWANFARYAEANASVTVRPRVVFMGDSITQYWAEQDPDFFTTNNFLGRGISGQASSKMLARFCQDVIELHPDAVVISCGTNDIAHNNGIITLENIVTQIRSMVELARYNGIKPIIASVTPSDYFYWRKEVEHPAPTIIELNKLIKAYADEAEVPYVDYHSAMAAPDGSMPKEYSEDGCHPVLAGFKVMEGIVLPVINSTLEN